MTPNRAELIKRLKEISDDKTEYEISLGAMCYSMSLPDEEEYICESCDKQIKYQFFMASYQEVYSLVKEIKDLGYDVKVEDLCANCLKKKVESGEYTFSDKILESLDKIGDCLNIVFYFRTNKDEKYHLAVSNDTYDYIALLTFLKGEKQYSGSFDPDSGTFGKTHLLREELDLIKYMSGLSIE